MRTSQALEQGIYQKTLYALRDLGLIEPLVCGVYRLVDFEIPPHVDLVAVSLLHPDTVFCLLTALDFHHITTTIPRSINIALPQGAKPPRIRGYMIHAYYYAQAQLESAVQVHEIAGVKLKIFSPEKTVVDCFKYVNKIGIATAVEALTAHSIKIGMFLLDLFGLVSFSSPSNSPAIIGRRKRNQTKNLCAKIIPIFMLCAVNSVLSNIEVNQQRSCNMLVLLE